MTHRSDATIGTCYDNYLTLLRVCRIRGQDVVVGIAMESFRELEGPSVQVRVDLGHDES